MGFDIFIIHVCILIQELCFDFFVKKLLFTPLRCYGFPVVVYCYMRLWMGLFASKDLIQAETAVLKKNISLGKKQQNGNYGFTPL